MLFGIGRVGRVIPAVAVAALTVAMGGHPAWAQDVSQKIEHGQINWTDKKIKVTGSGAPSLNAANVAVARLGAERAAKMEAFRNILEAVRGVKVNGTKSAADVMQDNAIRSKVEGVIRNFTVLDTKYYSDGGVDVIVEVGLDGVTAAMIGGQSKPPAGKTDVTGVVVNAKGLKVAPALAPRIVDESGKEIYGPSVITKTAVTSRGVASYTKSLDKAKKDGRVAGKPVIVKAVKLTESGSADLVVSKADGAKLAKLASVLADGRVIIVTD